MKKLKKIKKKLLKNLILMKSKKIYEKIKKKKNTKGQQVQREFQV